MWPQWLVVQTSAEVSEHYGGDSLYGFALWIRFVDSFCGFALWIRFEDYDRSECSARAALRLQSLKMLVF